MFRLIPILLLFLSISCSNSNSQKNNQSLDNKIAENQKDTINNENMTKWKATTIVTQQDVDWFGFNNCFKAEKIDSSVFKRINGCSWKSDCPVAIEDLRYIRILHRNANAQIQLGELIVNKTIAEKVVEIFKQLYQANYIIERVQLVDDFGGDDELSMQANNTSCFNYRTVANSTTISKHGYGLAIDLNPLYNPYVRQGKNNKWIIQPSTAEKYAFNRDTTTIPYKITHQDLAYKLFKEAGFTWGGDWNGYKDYQHFDVR